ncbi:MAG: DUF1559 domain-containing protein [Armatimonadetes bacterium]|nr:DUF1559 domain-containing protein [Armatimonadota bacterium]
MKARNSNRGRFVPLAAGFTLAELLMVTCILAVFAAIMYPVIMKTKETARTAECLSNMRQIGMSLHMYFDDYNGRFPAAVPFGSPDYWGTRDRKTIQELLLRYTSRFAIAQRVNGRIEYLSAGVFECPSDTGAPREYCKVLRIAQGKPVWKSTGCSYEYYASNQEDWSHSSLAVPWTALAPLLASAEGKRRTGAAVVDIPKLTRKAVLGDMFYWHLGDKTPDNHLAYCNTLFADGHAARVRGSEHLESRLERLRPWHNATEITAEE